MLTTDELVHISILALLDIPALALNSVLIVAICKRTPPSLRTYSVLLLNTAICDISAAVFSLTVAMRFINIDGAMVLVYAGPCTLLGSARFCHAMQAVFTSLMGHSYVLLLLSMSYRLWVLREESVDTGNSVKMRGRLLKVALASTAPSWLILFGIYNSADFDVPYVDAVLPGQVYGALQLLNEDSMFARCTVFLAACFFNGCLVATAAVRNRLLHRIKSISNGANRSRHQMVFNCLTAQALLPLSVVLGCAFWFIDFLDIFRSPYLQRAAHLTSSVFALGSPLINLTFLQPYRKYVRDLTKFKVQLDVSKTTSHNTTSRSRTF